MKILRKKNSKNNEVLMLVETGVSNKYSQSQFGRFSRLSIILIDKDDILRRVNQKSVDVICQKNYRISSSKNKTFFESSKYKKSSQYLVNEEMNENFDLVWNKLNIDKINKKELLEEFINERYSHRSC